MISRKLLLTGAVSSLLAIIITLMSFMPQVAQVHAADGQSYPESSMSYSPTQGIGIDLQKLLDATTDPTDTDGDGLPDSVERVLGTDPENTDSDLDRLDDYWEVDNDLDPMNPDSNYDEMPDYYEVVNVSSSDIDGDGIDNAWDFDNDGDGVNDGADLSPFVKIDVNEMYHFEITNNGNPFYMTFQLIPTNPEHLKLFGQVWDWPDSDKEGAIQDWDDSKEDIKVFPMLQLSVNDPPDPEEVIVNNITVDGNTVWVPLVPVTEYGSIVAFTGKMLYPTSTPQNLVVDARLIWRIASENDPDSETLGQDTLLVTYEDSFVLTGMTIEENYGTDVGLFYSQDIDQTVAANLLLAYQFLRNSDNHIADMPGVLDSENVSVIEQLDSFGHRDAALVAISNNMTSSALDILPDSQELPVVTILEDNSVVLDLSELEAGAIPGNSFSADLSAEPVMNTKTLKTSWYKTTDREAMQTGDVMTAITNLGLSENATKALVALNLFWNTGEQSVEGQGIPPTQPGDDYNLVTNAVERINGGGLSGLTVLYTTGLGLLAYYREIKTIAENFDPELVEFTKWEKFQKLIKEADNIQESSTFYGKMGDALDGLDMAALFLDAGFSAYSIVAIAQMSNVSGLQVNNAVMKVTMEYLFDVSMFAIGLIPYVGWLIAAAIELSDAFGGWSDDFTDWLVDVTSNVEHTVTPKIGIVGENMTVDDWDNNGVDVGDRITFSSSLTGNITGNEHYWTLVNNSEIYPYYNILPPAGSNSVVGFPYQREVVTDFGNQWFPITAPQISENVSAGWRAREYESAAWIEPGIAMTNFPVYVQINAYYQLWYEWSYFSWSIFNWGWHYHNSWQSGQKEVGHFISYIDTMPESIASFAQWRGITPLDHDSDGLKDSEEIPGAIQFISSGITPQNSGGEPQSDPWLFDTDADGLSDKYEVDFGTDPMKYDTDQDGLLDRYEIQYGCDPNNPDTDGDGLKDSIEVSGWVITFTYGGQEFTMRVYSDPCVSHSDDDGVDDATEYWSDLNPRSNDTNGDGIEDIADPKYLETQLHLDWTLNMEPPSGTVLTGKILDIALDMQENLYILREDMFEPTYPYPCYDKIYKYDSEGTFIKSWGEELSDWGVILININAAVEKMHVTDKVAIYKSDLNGEEPFINIIEDPWFSFNYIREIDTDNDGYIHIAQQRSSPSENASILTYTSNGTLVDSWGSFGIGPEQFQDIVDIAVDDTNGYIYVVDQRGEDTRIARFTTDGEYLRDMPDGYNHPEAIDIDTEGNLYVANTGNHEILKFNTDGMLLSSMGEYGEEEGNLAYPFRIQVSDDNNIYVVDKPSTCPLYRVQKFSQVAGGARPEIPEDVPDRDGDGLLNDVEIDGWDISYTDVIGSHTIHVTSDPLLADTDLDGLTDLQEHDMGTDPQDPDTDNDGLSDFTEWRGFSPQTNPRHFDTDGDDLPDGIEISFGSNPNAEDTDGEGLSDAREFGLGSNPNNTDTDGDGLNDADEESLNSDPFSPDSDGDYLFDGEEVNVGTDVNNGDTDNDGLSDGIEIVAFNTDPSKGDSDGDGINDGEEVEKGLNPLSEDTDNDGVPDNVELEQNTNPWMEDSDHDGVPDNEEEGNTAPVVDVENDLIINEGDTFTGSGSFIDPDTDDWSGGVDYGDGADIEPLTLELDNTFTLSHIYSDNGAYTVTVTVADDRGGEGNDTVLVTVNNIEPVVDAGPDVTITEGKAFTGSGSFTDPGADTWTATVDYGDSPVILPLTLNPDKSFVLNHTYSDNGTYMVTVNVIDDDGGIGSDSLVVTVIATPESLIDMLIGDIANLNIQKGIKNSLISKLEVAVKRLEDNNTQNDVAAINVLEAFINNVEAQRGKKLPEGIADELIAKVQDIIDALSGGT